MFLLKEVIPGQRVNGANVGGLLKYARLRFGATAGIRNTTRLGALSVSNAAGVKLVYTQA